MPRFSIVAGENSYRFPAAITVSNRVFNSTGTNWLENNTGYGGADDIMPFHPPAGVINLFVAGFIKFNCLSAGGENLDLFVSSSTYGTGWGVMQGRPKATTFNLIAHGSTNGSTTWGSEITLTTNKTYFYTFDHNHYVGLVTIKIFDPANSFKFVDQSIAGCSLNTNSYLLQLESGYIGDPAGSVQFGDTALWYNPSDATKTAVVPVVADDRIIPWNPGVLGGIPTNQTVWTNLTLLDNTGGTDVTSAINSTIDACPSNQVIAFPAGVFRVDGQVNLDKPVTLRGAGRTNTVLEMDSYIYMQSDLTVVTNRVAIANGSTRGSTNLVTTTTNLSLLVGNFAWVDQTNATINLYNDTNAEVTWDAWQDGHFVDDAVPQPATMMGGSNRVQGQWVRILSIDNVSNITFTPALYCDYTNAPSILVPANRLGVRRGVESLTISNSATPAYGLLGVYIADSWVKDVRFLKTPGGASSIFWEAAANCSVSGGDFLDSQLSGSVPWGKGVVIYGYTSDNLIENCVFDRHGNPIHLSYGPSAGNVAAYNFFSTNCYGSSASTVYQTLGITMNHGRQSFFNLCEGNIVGQIQSDYNHGSGTDNVVFRNWVRGVDRAENTSGAVSVRFDMKNRRPVIVGNVLGFSGISNAATHNVQWYITYTNELYSYTASWYGIRLGFPDASGESDKSIGDKTTVETALVHGNYEYFGNVAHWDSSIQSQTIPHSLYLTAAPSWWGTNRWPAIDPTATPLVAPIPAELRFAGIIDSGGETPGEPQAIGTIRSGFAGRMGAGR
jgi:hypothetical protein